MAVSASTGAMGSLLGKLATMLTDEYKLLKGVRADINSLKEELESMHGFLLDMAAVERPDMQAKIRANAVRELSYAIEDSIDKFMLLVHDESGSTSDGIKKLFLDGMNKIKNIRVRHKIAKNVEGIKRDVDEVANRYARYKIDDRCPPRNEVDPRLRDVYKDASELVGIDGPRDELMNVLNQEKGKPARVISIVGSGGLGKTTLAQQVRGKIAPNFECQAFLSISRKPNICEILGSILSQISNKSHDNAKSEVQLIDKIRDFLKDKRYLIIIDDIWDRRTWGILERAFVKNMCGSRLMVTTRNHDVAKSCCSSPEDVVYEIQPLSEADSKVLFFKRIFGCEEKCPSNLKEASEDILKKCGGLPLAINAISSLLATSRPTREEWDRVRHSIGSSKGKNEEIDAMGYILSLSYFDLPYHLRSCLLYLTLFPEDYKIERQRLVLRWISEGFILEEKGRNLVEVGEKYFHELVNRSLILPVEIGYDGKAEYCRVHDTILDFLIDKSTEENFSTSLSKNDSTPGNKIRRLYLTGIEEEYLERLDLSHARSLTVYRSTMEQSFLGKPQSRGVLPQPWSFLMRARSLRVLDLRDCSGLSDDDIKDIWKLRQLRYLDLGLFSRICELPRQIGNLQHLETLDMNNVNLTELPDRISRLQRLERLFVRSNCKLPAGFGKLVNLQELENIDVLKLEHAEELGQLTKLRKLMIRWDTREGLVKDNASLVPDLLTKLEACSLRYLSINILLGKEDGDVLLPALHCFQEVNLMVGDFCAISNWLASLPSLRKLYIQVDISEQDIHMISRMQSLVELSIDKSAYDSQQLIITGQGFQQLQSFYFENADEGCLMFEAGAMPNLKELCLSVDFIMASRRSAGADFQFGIQHLSSLARLRVGLHCYHATVAEVEAAEDAFRSMAKANPNCPTLVMTRYAAHRMHARDKTEGAHVSGASDLDRAE